MTWLLSLLLGVFGADRFYLGKIGTAIAKLLTLGGLGIWWLVDLIITVFGKQTDKLGRPLDGYSGLRTVSLIVTPIVVIVLIAINPMRSVGSASEPAAVEPAAVEPAVQPAAPAAQEPAPTREVVAPETEVAAEPTEDATVADPPVAAAPYGTEYPDTQQAFLDRIQQASDEFDAATTDLQRSQVLTARNADLCTITGGSFENWVGSAMTIGATGDGNAYVDIEIADNVVVSTWNNEFSDIGDDTLVPVGSDLFNVLLEIPEDTLVTFSGRFASGGDSCLKTDNLTEIFDVIDPNFVSHFSAVTPQ